MAAETLKSYSATRKAVNAENMSGKSIALRLIKFKKQQTKIPRHGFFKTRVMFPHSRLFGIHLILELGPVKKSKLQSFSLLPERL